MSEPLSRECHCCVTFALLGIQTWRVVIGGSRNHVVSGIKFKTKDILTPNILARRIFLDFWSVSGGVVGRFGELTNLECHSSPIVRYSGNRGVLELWLVLPNIDFVPSPVTYNDGNCYARLVAP